MLQYGRLYPIVGGCAPVWEGVPYCGSVRPSVVLCSPVWEGVRGINKYIIYCTTVLYS